MADELRGRGHAVCQRRSATSSGTLPSSGILAHSGEVQEIGGAMRYTRADVIVGGLWLLSFLMLAIVAGLRLAS